MRRIVKHRKVNEMFKKICMLVVVVVACSVAQFNWSPIEIQQPKFKSASDIMKGMMEVREMRRKYAIERAIRESLNSDGYVVIEDFRRNLISYGFGENVDSVVRVLKSYQESGE